MKKTTLFILAWLGMAGVWPNPQALGEGGERISLRALLVIDTNSNLGESVSHDGKTMENLLVATIPSSRLKIDILQGNQVTPGNVLNYYRNLKVGPGQTLLFFYAGHGGTDQTTKRHMFFFQGGKEGLQLYRDQLRQAMLDRGPDLALILTDCCSNPVKVRKTKNRDVYSPAQNLDPTVRCLFFRHHGLVDITASTDSPSWGDDDRGGIFTRTFERMVLRTSFQELDVNHKGFVTWKDFFPILETKTNESFQRWKQVEARGENISQNSQKPRAFSLPDPDLNVSPMVKTSRSYAVITLKNATDQEISFEFRWSTSGQWKAKKLSAQETTPFAIGVNNNGGMPFMEVRFGSSNAVKQLASKIWSGEGLPNKDCGKQYVFSNSSSSGDRRAERGLGQSP